jgi:hypothetical protein
MTSINPDAHSADELDLTHWGVEMARKGAVPADRILNVLTLSQTSSFFQNRGSHNGKTSKSTGRSRNESKRQTRLADGHITVPVLPWPKPLPYCRGRWIFQHRHQGTRSSGFCLRKHTCPGSAHTI